MHPAPIPSTGVHARAIRGARSISPSTVATVTSAIVGAAAAGAPRGISVSSAKPIGTTVTEMSARRVPDTTGVMIRLSWLRRAAITNWQTADATTKVASSSGPPADRARTATPMEVPDAPITIRLPAPIPATRLACRMVVSPPISMLAKMAHER